jgi:hypothetical protein
MVEFLDVGIEHIPMDPFCKEEGAYILGSEGLRF